MTLTLQIENETMLDAGGAARVTVPETGLSAGRAATSGWQLPDASRHISSHHFDIYREDGAWWLRDVSTNGTFLLGQRYRLEGPHRLASGDRFQVGQYQILALIENEGQRPVTDPLPQLHGLFRREPTPAGAFTRAQTPQARTAAGGPHSRPLPDLPFGAPPPPQPAPFPPPRPLPADLDERHEITGIRMPGPAMPSADFVTAFCNGAGLPSNLYADVDAPTLAQTLGQALRQASQQVMLALQDRAAAKQFARAGDRTMRNPQDNNPLKFLPDADQAVEAMFLRPRPGFQTGADALTDALADLRLHQAAMFAALQPALAALLHDLDPAAIEAEAEIERAGGSRHAKSWEIFVRRWQAKIAASAEDAGENGLLDEFLTHFAAAYSDLIDHSPRDGAADNG